MQINQTITGENLELHEWTERIPEPVIRLIRQLDENGYETWLVGGCVRDMSLGILPDDYDAATNAKPEQVCRIFEKCLETGIRHGTVTVLLSGLAIEVTTFRSEGPYSDGRRPDHIRFENGVLPDLARRDFTINSMAWHPERGLIDPYGGLADLQRLQLRCVGSASERIQEDALRQLRAVRFSLSYDLKPDDDLLDAIRQGCSLVRNLSTERLSHELSRLMLASYSHNLSDFSDSNLLGIIAEKLLGFSVDSKIFSENLACFIQPFWKKEQIWPSFYLAGRMAELNINPKYLSSGQIGYFSQEGWQSIKSCLTADRLNYLPLLLVSKAKLSKESARITQAILILIGLRLMLYDAFLRKLSDRKANNISAHASPDYHFNNGCLSHLQVKILLRSCIRRTKLSPELIIECLNMANEIIHALQADPQFAMILEQDQINFKEMKNSRHLLLTQDLDIKGNNIIFNKLKLPRQRGLYLERLLSLSIINDVEYSEALLESYLMSWLHDYSTQNY
jgi:hypothetical protein